LLLFGQQGLGHFFKFRPLHPFLAGGLCKFYANARGKQPINRQPLLVQYQQEQQANLLLSMNNYKNYKKNNYTQFVIGRNDKNKQLTVFSQRKLT
jgi:hypothetical protein